MVFTLECDGNTFDEKGMIEDSLPEGFTYKIAKYKVIERSEIKEEIKFRADFSVSVSDKEEAIIFIEKIATLDGTELRPSTKEIRKKDFASQLFLGIIAKDCFLTLVKSRLLLGSPGWSVGCFHAENGLIHRKMVVNCPIMITSKVKPFSRPHYTGKGE